MSQHRTDRIVVGGRRATAGGRAHALRARGYDPVAALLRAHRVFELRQQGHTVQAVAEMVGISKSQAQRDYDSVLYSSPERHEKEELGNELLRLWLLGRQVGKPQTYPALAEITGICERRIGDLVRAARMRALRRVVWEFERAKHQDVLTPN